MTSPRDLEEISRDKKVEEGIERVENDGQPFNGLAQHIEFESSPEELRAKKRFVLKVDLTILPLLSLTLF